MLNTNGERSINAMHRAKSILDETEEQIKQLEAIKYYDRVKRELEEANATNQQFRSRIQTLEQLKLDTNGKTLSETEEHFLRVKHDEIKHLAENRFNIMKAEWRQSQKPKEVELEARKKLITELDKIRLKGPLFTPAEKTQTTSPDRELQHFMQEAIDVEVQRRCNAEFKKSIEEKSQSIARLKINELKSTEWPNWKKQNVDPKVEQLERLLWTNTLQALKEPWDLTCERCGALQTLTPNNEDIAALIQTGLTRLNCANRSCNHLLTIDLKKMIRERITGA